MRIRQGRFGLLLVAWLSAALPAAALAAPLPQTAAQPPPIAVPMGPAGGPLSAAGGSPAPQSPAQAAGFGGWEITGQLGTGLSFYFGDQTADPAFSLSAGRFVSPSMQVEAQFLGVAGPLRESFREEHVPVGDGDGTELYSTSLLRIQRQMYLALTRMNIHLGDGRVRPYLSFGAGLGWGSEQEQHERTCFAPQCVDYPAGDRDETQQSIAFATLLGTGIDIALTDRWRLRPEVVMPLLLGAPQGGYVTLALGITYATAPRPTDMPTRYPRPRAGEPLSSAWSRVAALPLGDLVRVQLRRGAAGLLDGTLEHPESRVLVGTFVAADDDTLVVRVLQGARSGNWRFPRTRVERIERGRRDRDGPGAGVLGGFVGGALFGAAWYLGSGGGEDHEIAIPASTVLFGGPAALIGGLADYASQSFEVTELVYDVRLVVPG